MKNIIIVSFISCLTFSTLAVAEIAERPEELKQKLIQHVDNEIVILTQFKTCIQAAQNLPDFESCRNVKNEAQKKQLLEMKRARLENRKKRLAFEEKQFNDAAKTDKK